MSTFLTLNAQIYRLQRSATPEPFVSARTRPRPAALNLPGPRQPQGLVHGALQTRTPHNTPLPSPHQLPAGQPDGAPRSAAPCTPSAQKLNTALHDNLMQLSGSSAARPIKEWLQMMHLIAAGQHNKSATLALGQMFVAGTAARAIAVGQDVPKLPVWDFVVEAPPSGFDQAVDALKGAKRTTNRKLWDLFIHHLSVQSNTLVLSAHDGQEIRLHVCAQQALAVPGALACEQLLLRVSDRAWHACAHTVVTEAWSWALAGVYEPPSTGALLDAAMPADVQEALDRLMQIWRLQSQGYAPPNVIHAAEGPAAAVLGQHLADVAQAPRAEVARNAASFIRRTLAPALAPRGSSQMRQQLGLAATAWVYLHEWQSALGDWLDFNPLTSGLRSLCQSHMQPEYADERLAFAIVQGLTGTKAQAALWQTLVQWLPESAEGPHVRFDGPIVDVALPVWSTHVFVQRIPLAYPELGNGDNDALAILRDPRAYTKGEIVARILGTPGAAVLIDHPRMTNPAQQLQLAHGLAHAHQEKALTRAEARRRLLALAVLDAKILRHEQTAVTTHFDLTELAETLSCLPMSSSAAPATGAVIALLQIYLSAADRQDLLAPHLRQVRHRLVKQFTRRCCAAQSMALLALEPALALDVGGAVALSLLASDQAHTMAPDLAAALVAAVAGNYAASRKLSENEPCIELLLAHQPALVPLASVLAQHPAPPKVTWFKWHQAAAQRGDVDALLAFLSTAKHMGETFTMTLESLVAACETQKHRSGLHQALILYRSARQHISSEQKTSIALPLLRCACAQAQADLPLLSATNDELVALCQDVLKHSSDGRTFTLAISALMTLTGTPQVLASFVTAMEAVSDSLLASISYADKLALVEMGVRAKLPLSAVISVKACSGITSLLSNMQISNSKAAHRMGTFTTYFLTAMVQQGHFVPARRLLLVLVNSPAAMRATWSAFEQMCTTTLLSDNWCDWLDSLNTGMSALRETMIKIDGIAPALPNIFAARVIFKLMDNECTAYERLDAAQQNAEAKGRIFDVITYAIVRRTSLVRLLPDDPILEPIMAFIVRHRLGIDVLERLTETYFGKTSKQQADSKVTSLTRVMTSFDEIFPLDLWIIALKSLEPSMSVQQKQTWALKTFEKITTKRWLLDSAEPAENGPTSLGEVIIASHLAEFVLAGNEPLTAAENAAIDALCSLHLDTPSVIPRLVRLSSSVAHKGDHPIFRAINHIAASKAPQDALDAATLHVTLTLLLTASTVPVHEMTRALKHLMATRTQPMSAQWAAAFRHSAFLILQYASDHNDADLQDTAKAFIGRCLAPHGSWEKGIQQGAYGLQSQFETCLLRLRSAPDLRAEAAVGVGLFKILRSLIDTDARVQLDREQATLHMLCAEPNIANILRRELLATMATNPQCFSREIDVQWFFDALFSMDSNVRGTLAVFFAMHQLHKESGAAQASHWRTLEQLYIPEAAEVQDLIAAKQASTGLLASVRRSAA